MKMTWALRLLCVFVILAGIIMPASPVDYTAVDPIEAVRAAMSPQQRAAYDREQLCIRFNNECKSYLNGIGISGLGNPQKEVAAFGIEDLGNSRVAVQIPDRVTEAQMRNFIAKVDAVYELGNRLKPQLLALGSSVKGSLVQFAQCVPVDEQYAWLETQLKSPQNWQDACARYATLSDDGKARVCESLRKFQGSLEFSRVQGCIQAIQKELQKEADDARRATVAVAQVRQEAIDKSSAEFRSRADDYSERRKKLFSGTDDALVKYFDTHHNKDNYVDPANGELLKRLEENKENFDRVHSLFCATLHLFSREENQKRFDELERNANGFDFLASREEKLRWYEAIVKNPEKYQSLQARADLILEVHDVLLAEKKSPAGIHYRDIGCELERTYQDLVPAIDQDYLSAIFRLPNSHQASKGASQVSEGPQAKQGNKFPWISVGISLLGFAFVKIVHEYYVQKPTDKDGKKLSLMAYCRQQLASIDYKKLSFALKFAGLGALGVGSYYYFTK